MLLHYPKEILSELGGDDFFYPSLYSSDGIDWSATVRLGKILARNARRRTAESEITVDGKYNQNSEAFKVTREIFDAFYSEVEKTGRLPS